MTVDLSHDGLVAVVTLDRPSRRNAVDHATLLELLDVQAAILARSPDAIRAVVLTGKPPAFSAGADLNGVEEGQFATDLGAVLSYRWGQSEDLFPWFAAGVAFLAGPVLIVGLVVGVAVSLFQALTSVQEQTMSLVPKMLAVMLVTLLLLAPALQLLADFTSRVFDQLVEFGLS